MLKFIITIMLFFVGFSTMQAQDECCDLINSSLTYEQPGSRLLSVEYKSSIPLSGSGFRIKIRHFRLVGPKTQLIYTKNYKAVATDCSTAATRTFNIDVSDFPSGQIATEVFLLAEQGVECPSATNTFYWINN